MFTQDQLKADITLDVRSSSFWCSLWFKNAFTYGRWCHSNSFLILRNHTRKVVPRVYPSCWNPFYIRYLFGSFSFIYARQTSYIILLKDFICWSMSPQDGWWVKRKLLVKVCPDSYLITLGPLNSWLAWNVSRTLMVNNGLMNTVGVNLIHRSIIRFTSSGRRITFFAPANIYKSWIELHSSKLEISCPIPLGAIAFTFVTIFLIIENNN